MDAPVEAALSQVWYKKENKDKALFVCVSEFSFISQRV